MYTARRKMAERSKRELLDRDDYSAEKIISQGLMNHFRRMIADGGIGYISPERLIFVPHKLNLSNKEVNIPFSEVESITNYKICGIFDTGMKIIMKSGKVEKFVINKTTPFYKMLSDMILK
jgi:hypothetical protein